MTTSRNLPFVSAKYSSNVVSSNSKSFGEHFWRFCGRSNFFDIFKSQSSRMMQFTDFRSTSVSHVASIFLRCTSIQMIWIYTASYIAFVINLLSFWNNAVSKFVRKTMSVSGGRPSSKFTVPALCINSTNPKPASIWRIFINLFPKTILYGFKAFVVVTLPRAKSATFGFLRSNSCKCFAAAVARFFGSLLLVKPPASGRAKHSIASFCNKFNSAVFAFCCERHVLLSFNGKWCANGNT